MRSVLSLRAATGPQKGRTFEFDRHDIFVFGRSRESHCSIPEDPFISGSHFLLEVNPPEAELRDLGSKNGTFVNDIRCGGREKGESPQAGASRARPVALKHGDRIRAGNTEFEVSIASFEECGACGKEFPAAAGREPGAPFTCEACQRFRKPTPESPLADLMRPSGSPPAAPGGAPAAPTAPGDKGGLDEFLANALGPRTAGGDDRFPGYAIQKEIKEGGMGKVYLVHREKDGRPFALKCIKPTGRRVSRKQVELFNREMEVTMGLDHRNIVAFVDKGVSGGSFFFVMEFCDQGSVSDLLDKSGPRLPLDLAGKIVLQSLDGLAHAHGRSIVHRDIKPGNILISGRGEAMEAKLADFGLAKNFINAGLSGMTAGGSRGGTLAFMPKEQLRSFRETRPVSDVFAMGATFYHMVTGVFIYDFDAERDRCAAILNDRLIPIGKRDAGLRGEVEAVVDKATAPDWRARYQTAAEFRDALARAMG